MGNIKFDIYESPQSKRSKKSYHVRVVNNELIEFDRVKSDIQLSSAASEGDVSLVTQQLSSMVSRALSNGKRIHIEGLGYFSLGIETDSTSDKRTINGTKVRMRGINFTPDKELLTSIEPLHFVRAAEKSHSLSTTYAEKQAALKDYFRTHRSINRADYQRILCLTRNTAIRQLNELCKQPLAVFRKEGAKNSPVYIPVKESEFWK